MLKTFVVVGEISNLSDARYCAGMGVDVLGFNVNPVEESCVEPDTLNEIAGWVAGVEYLGDISGLVTHQANEILKDYNFTYVLSDDLATLQEIGEYRKVLKVDIESESQLQNFEALITGDFGLEYVIVYTLNENYVAILDGMDKSGSNVKLIKAYQLEKDNVESTGDLGYNGIYLKGTAEIRPGYKDYDELADILEVLEID